MAFQVGSHKPSVDSKAALIQAAKAAAGKSEAALVKYISPDECADRTRIVFDDSISMCEQIENAKQGVVEFLRNCIPNQTAVAVHFMSTDMPIKLNSNLLELARDVQSWTLNSGGTPFFNTMKKALQAKPTLTRLIAFTDGSPTDSLKAEADEADGLQGFHSFSRDTWTASADIIIKIALSVGGGEKHIRMRM